MKSFLLIFAVLFALASSQDVPIGSDILGTSTSAPNTTIFEVEYNEESTDDSVEETTVEDDLSWVEGNDDNATLPPPDSLIRPQFPSVTPIPLPPFESNCTIQLPPSYIPSNQPPLIIPPIINSTIDPIEREETLICPVGSVQVGSVCNTTYSNECPEGYTFNGERCVIKFTNCPLNFELNEFGRCVQRQLCPHNHVLRNGRCEPMTHCPSGWRWNGDHCEVVDIQCQPGSILRGNECVSESFSCPIGYDQKGDECVKPKLLCPPGFKMTDSGFCSQVTTRCPPGSVMINGECHRTVISCPIGTHQIGNQCYQVQTERPTCPHGFVLIGNMCNMITTQRPTENPELVCPPETIKIGFACYYYKTVTDPPIVICPPGYALSGNKCMLIQNPTPSPPIVIEERCPDGYYRIGSTCYPNPTERPVVTPPTIICPPGFYKDRNRCLPFETNVTCPPNTFESNGHCYPIVTQRPETPTPTAKPVVPGQPGFPTPPPFPGYPQTRCPESYVPYNNQCYRCPPNFDLCDNKCVRSGHSCGQFNYPNININIYSRDHRATGKVHNIINQIEPINNTIVNINNITHPVTLNNVVENNIYIYSDARCPDGSIRTIVVKNNETVNGCVDVNTDKGSDPSSPSDIDDKDDEASEKCCEVITPRQCKKRNSNQWICTHRRYKYCGKFCIADRLYLKPPATTYRNNVLTIVPSQPVHNSPPCFGRNCPEFDCSGCIDGSFNCSSQCYTYPCNHAGCHYLSEEDFCAIVGGQICEPDR